ncbi:MAG: amidohydrolase family protein [Spirochaetales bacterium]|nr:amidohydrolase family protein [Spirochaetales bacterium]
MKLCLKNCASVVTNSDTGPEFLYGQDIILEDDRIKQMGATGTLPYEGPILDCTGLCAIPGLVQTHIHLCQTPFRNTADDVELLDWLSAYIWPGESRLSSDELLLGARIGIAELLRGGTTTILDMATIRHTDAVFQALEESGLRAISGKCLMDDQSICPPELVEDTASALKETEELIERWHGKNGLLEVAITPRFAVSCTTDLMRECARLSEKYNLIIHTHASENKKEIELVRNKTGYGNLEYLEKIGFMGPRTCIAHCVHMEEDDWKRLKVSGSHVLHCPSSNLKLASGIAPVPRMLEEGISVSLGADGPPCNNLLDGFMEMRLAALIQKPFHGPTSMNARTVFRMATLDGARALGKDAGRIEPGRLADIALLDTGQVHNVPSAHLYSTLVYATRASDVRHVVVGGSLRLQDGRLTYGNRKAWLKEFRIAFEARP